MRHSFILVCCISAMFVSITFCSADTSASRNDNNTLLTAVKMKIIIGDKTFIATLNENATANAFKDLLPLSLNMIELNGNEKYADFSQSLKTNASNPATINAGDIMLYGSSTVVLFYKTFATSYSYTKLGKIDDIEGLTKAVGPGNVIVRFELSK